MLENVFIKQIKLGQKTKKIEDKVVSEVPLTIVFNKEELTTLLCSPVKLEELLFGFLMVEGLIQSKEDVSLSGINQKTLIGYVETKNNITVKDFDKKRVITSGCARGQTFYNYKDFKNCKPIKSALKVSAENILKIMKEFQKKSVVFKETGGVHSAALCDKDKIIAFSEDIGRHNAIDKIVGEVILNGNDIKDKFIVTSGRISSEIVIKTARLKVPVIVSRSAPTELAVKIAKELNITLVGFARGNKMNVYSFDERII